MAQAVFQLRRRRALAHRDAGAGGVEQRNGFVRQLTRRDVAVGQLHRRADRFVEQQHLVVRLQRRHGAAQHQNGFRFVRLVNLHRLETTGQRRVFLNVLFVFCPGGGADGAQLAARQGWLQQVRRIAGPLLAACANQGVDLIDKQNDRGGAGLDFVNERLQTGFKLAFHACTGLQHTDIQQPQLNVLQRLRHVAVGDTQRQPFHHRRFPDSGLPGQQRVVLTTAHQDIDHLADLLVAPDDRVNLPFAGAGGQVLTVLGQRPLCSRNRPRRCVDGGSGLLCFFTVGADGIELLNQYLDVKAGKLRRNAFQYVGQIPGFEYADQQMAAANAADAKLQRAEDPGALHGAVDMLGEIGNGTRPARKHIQRGNDIARQLLLVEGKVADDLLQIAILLLHQLMQPVHQLNIGVAAQLAERSGAFQRGK